MPVSFAEAMESSTQVLGSSTGALGSSTGALESSTGAETRRARLRTGPVPSGWPGNGVPRSRGQGFGRGAHALGGDSGAGGGSIRSRKWLASSAMPSAPSLPPGLTRPGPFFLWLVCVEVALEIWPY